MTNEDFSTLCVCAIRYCQGRKTYMPALVQRIVKDNIGMITTNTLEVLIQDCKFQASMNLYGDEEIDKPGWISWKEFLITELKNRENEMELVTN